MTAPRARGPRPPRPLRPEEIRRIMKASWAALIALLVTADVVMTATGDEGRWHALIRHCLNRPEPSEVAPAPASTTGP